MTNEQFDSEMSNMFDEVAKKVGPLSEPYPTLAEARARAIEIINECDVFLVSASEVDPTEPSNALTSIAAYVRCDNEDGTRMGEEDLKRQAAMMQMSMYHLVEKYPDEFQHCLQRLIFEKMPPKLRRALEALRDDEGDDDQPIDPTTNL